MKTVAAIFADFDATFLGGPSRLDAPLGATTVLGHTAARASRSGADACCVVVRPEHEARARATLDGAAGCDVLPLDDGRRKRRELFRAARKWNLESWRGGVCGVTYFDEFVEPLCVGRVLDHYGADAVLCCDGHMPALDPAIAQAMIAHKDANADEAPFVFTQAPPGLAGIILRRDVTRDLLQHDMPIGLYLSYRPEIAQGDPITRAQCLQLDPAITHVAARLTADTARSGQLLAAAFAELGDACDGRSLAQWASRPPHDRAGPLPVEVELEITSDDPLPDTTLRPRGGRVPRRQLDDLAAVEKLARELGELDDRLVVLGGFGDPLLHPRFGEVCAAIRGAGVCGIAVVTPLVELSDANLDTLFTSRIDVLEVLLDAHTAETYRTVNRADHFGRVVANIQRIQAERTRRVSPQPLVAPCLTRCAVTLADMEPFFDHWIRTVGTAVIAGYNEFCGRMPAGGLLAMTPPIRRPCRRLGARMMLLADGSAVTCSQDIDGQTRFGDWRTESLTQLWRSPALELTRAAHSTVSLGNLPLCVSCGEWFRP